MKIFEWLSDFFSPQLGNYKNLKFSSTSFVSFKVVLTGIFFGVILASLNMLYNRRLLGDFVRAVTAAGADSPEKAMTLSELGYSKNPFVRYSLTRGYTLRRTVRCVESEQRLREEEKELDASKDTRKKRVLTVMDIRPDAKTAHFYIPSDEIFTAEEKFDKKGTNWFTFILTVIIMTVLMAAVVHFLPDMLRLIDNMISGFGK